jgi:predicted O-methyltransferase YrrM
MSDWPPVLKHAFTAVQDAQAQIVKSDERLDNAASHSERSGLPPISVGAAQGKFLALLCQMSNAKRILEIGTLGGYSTIWFATSTPNVKVTSIEYSSKHRDIALHNTKGLDNVDIRLGAALDVLPVLAQEGLVFDFVFIDADWENQQQYFDWAVQLSRPKSCIVVDNAVRQITESEPDDPTRKALVEHVQKDDRVEATLIPWLNTRKTTLSEAVDGFVMAIVK